MQGQKQRMLSPTFSFLLEGLGLGDGEALHHLVALTSLLVLRARLVGRPDQHPAAEGMAVAPGRFLRPRNSIYWGMENGGEEELLGAAPCPHPPAPDFPRPPWIRGQKEKHQHGGRKQPAAQLRGKLRAELGADPFLPALRAPSDLLKTPCPGQRSQPGPESTYNPK